MKHYSLIALLGLTLSATACTPVFVSLALPDGPASLKGEKTTQLASAKDKTETSTTSAGQQDAGQTATAGAAEGTAQTTPVSDTGTTIAQQTSDQDIYGGTATDMASGKKFADQTTSSLTVNFDFDSTTMNMTSDLNRSLKPLISAMKQSNVRVNIDGYTDDMGPKYYNDRLSERRAEAVKEFLAHNGVSTDRMVTKGHGQTNFVAGNDTEEGRAMNRRVEISIPVSVVNFDFNSTTLNVTADTYAALKPFVESMKEDPSIRIRLDAYTDDVGSTEFNKKLAQQRAVAVADYLEYNGISRDRIETRNLGKTSFLASNATEEGRAINRRVEIYVVK